MILAKSRPSVFLPTIMFLWGCATIGMAWVPNYKALIGLRTVIGVLESGFAPGILLILSSWYKPEEQAKRFGVYISAAILSGAFGGLIAGAIEQNLDGAHGLPGWRWLFIVSLFLPPSTLYQNGTKLIYQPPTGRRSRHSRLGHHSILHPTRLPHKHQASHRPRARASHQAPAIRSPGPHRRR